MTSVSWEKFFDDVVRLLQELDRQYGVSNMNYAHYALERLEVCLSSCRALGDRIASSNQARVLQEYSELFEDLVKCLTDLRRKWSEYEEILCSSGGDATRFAFRVPVSTTHRPGKPKFCVSREQMEYLWSLSFPWSEIATLFGISRTTLYRLVFHDIDLHDNMQTNRCVYYFTHNMNNRYTCVLYVKFLS